MTAASDELRAWAEGLNHRVAAVELLVRAFSGRFAAEGNPWIVRYADDGLPVEGRLYVDPEVIRQHADVYSGGERRVLTLVASLVDEQPVNIVDVVSGVDRDVLALVLAALSHAGSGTDGNTLLVRSSAGTALVDVGPVMPWPDVLPAES